jgi:hypothetical protein
MMLLHSIFKTQTKVSRSAYRPTRTHTSIHLFVAWKTKKTFLSDVASFPFTSKHASDMIVAFPDTSSDQAEFLEKEA